MSGVIVHKSKPDVYVLNFPATENNLSWSIPNQADGEIYLVELTNVASYQISGVTQVITPSAPYPISAGVKYNISINKTINGQVAIIRFYCRRSAERTTTISVPDFGNLTITSNYILLTNTGNNGVVIVTNNSNITTSNYAGAGVFNNSLVRASLTLPDISTAYGSPAFSWTCIVHAKHNGSDKVLVIGHATSSNSNRGRVVCLIDPLSLIITDLDGNVGSWTYITPNKAADSSWQRPLEYIAENFISNKFVLGYGLSISELDINNRVWDVGTNLTVFPFNGQDAGINGAYLESYYNPIDQAYIGYIGQFTKTRGSSYGSAVSHSAYDYATNAKIGTLQFWGRIKYYNFNGMTVKNLDNTSLSGAASLIMPKGNVLYLVSTTYIGFMLQNTPYSMARSAHENKNWTGIKQASYASNDGKKWLTLTNNNRLVISFFDTNLVTVSQAYFDLPSVPLWICNDKTLISI